MLYWTMFGPKDPANVRQAFLSDKRLIVTNFHVIHSGEAPRVIFIPADGLDLETSEIAYSSVVSTVPEKDLALLLVNARPAHVGA